MRESLEMKIAKWGAVASCIIIALNIWVTPHLDEIVRAFN